MIKYSVGIGVNHETRIRNIIMLACKFLQRMVSTLVMVMRVFRHIEGAHMQETRATTTVLIEQVGWHRASRLACLNRIVASLVPDCLMMLLSEFLFYRSLHYFVMVFVILVYWILIHCCRNQYAKCIVTNNIGIITAVMF